MKLKNIKWEEEKFLKERNDVLKGWPTGSQVDIEESINYHKSILKNKVSKFVLKKAKEEGKTLTQPRAGVALINDHIKLLQYLEKEGMADFLPTTIDSYTRLNRYEEAQKGIDESIRLGRSMLNGFPAVNHGVDGCRKVVESVNVPVEVRHGTPDSRLLAEITLAGGFTDFEGGAITYNVPYSKDVSIEKSIKNWQYVDRLIGYYQENSVDINRESFGPLTGTLVPPCVSNAVSIAEALLATTQGVKSISIGYGQCGNLIQDIAAIKSLSILTEEYLRKFGYTDVLITTVFHQWMGGFPYNEAEAFAVISWGSVAAGLGGATKVIVKTPHEAYGIPSKEANALGLRATKQILNMVKDQKLTEIELIEKEIDIIKEETNSILEAVLNLGKGDIAIGLVRGFEAGVIDVPFAPSRFTMSKIIPARDNHGAVRFLNIGNLPFSKRIKKFHKRKLEERGKIENRKPSYKMVVDDIYAISKGYLVGKSKK